MNALDHILHDYIELGEMVKKDGRETRLGSGGVSAASQFPPLFAWRYPCSKQPIINLCLSLASFKVLQLDTMNVKKADWFLNSD